MFRCLINSSNLLFCFMVMLSPVLALSSGDWVICWAGMELGLIGLFPLINSSESMMKYFLIQSVASIFLLLSGVMLFYYLSDFGDLVFLMSLSLKIGFFPGHFWVPSLISSLTWMQMLLVLGPMKIAPFGFLTLFSDKMLFIFLLGSASAIVGSVLGFSQASARGMLGASSVSHSGWMMVSMFFNFLWGYFICYLFILFMMMISFLLNDNFNSSIVLLSLSGLPPFLMFVFKVKILLGMIFSLEYLYFLILIVSSVISLTFYMKFCFYFMLMVDKLKNFFVTVFFVMVNLLGVLFLGVLFFESLDKQ